MWQRHRLTSNSRSQGWPRTPDPLASWVLRLQAPSVCCSGDQTQNGMCARWASPTGIQPNTYLLKPLAHLLVRVLDAQEPRKPISYIYVAFPPPAKGCLKMNPDDRLTCAQLLDSAYLDSLREDQMKRKARSEGRSRRRQQVPQFTTWSHLEILLPPTPFSTCQSEARGTQTFSLLLFGFSCIYLRKYWWLL